MTNHEIIETFYTAFSNKDYKTMQNLYADNAVFNDAVFTNLNSKQVKAMWQMLISRGKEMKITFNNIQIDNNKGSVYWEASYLFSATQKRVLNKIKANFIFENGKIMQHTDQFNFYNWSAQAFGWKGKLLGIFPFFRKKVQQTAMQNLNKFMQKM